MKICDSLGHMDFWDFFMEIFQRNLVQKVFGVGGIFSTKCFPKRFLFFDGNVSKECFPKRFFVSKVLMWFCDRVSSL